MSEPDFERTKQYVTERLLNDLSPDMHYHSLIHTRDEVVPAIERMAATENVQGEDLLLLRTAAWFHDLGFVEQYKDHETASARIAGHVLPGFGYNPTQVSRIQAIIMVTKLPQAPKNILEEIMADADLDVLGREDYIPRNRQLRAELEATGLVVSDERWYGDQLRFIQNHQYFTQSCRTYRQTAKQRNVKEMASLLAECQQKSGSPSS